MPDTRVLIELDGQPLADEDFGRLADVQVEEATDQADAATLVAPLEAGADGEWTSLLDPLTAPRSRPDRPDHARRGALPLRGAVDRGQLGDRRRRRLAADREGSGPHARARRRGEGGGLAWHLGQRDSRLDLQLLRADPRGGGDCRLPPTPTSTSCFSAPPTGGSCARWLRSGATPPTWSPTAPGRWATSTRSTRSRTRRASCPWVSAATPARSRSRPSSSRAST